jgi:spermidine synthase
MRLRDRLWNPYVIVFMSSACIMVIELVASRLIAPRLGVSLYTWTSVIGVILAGISLGNYLGGRLSDRFASRPFLGLILALASLGSLSILGLNKLVGGVGFAGQLPLMIWVVLNIAAVFFLPSVILGCVSPIVVKLSLTDLSRSGTTVGKIYAWSTAGSIVGTFATGFYLISAFGTKTIILMVAGLLLLMALWFLTDARKAAAIISSVIVIALWGGAFRGLYAADLTSSECLRESNYFCIKVWDRNVGGNEVRELVLDRLVHSYTHLDDPTVLTYAYEKIYAEMILPLRETRPDAHVLFIGGGGYTFPRYMEETWPDSHLVVSEIDPAVTEVAYDRLGLAPDTRIVTYNLDARIMMEREGVPDSYDIIFGDAFNDYSVPFHLTTLEFNQIVDRLLREDGLYLVNIIDGGPRGHFMRAYVRTLQQVFKHVMVIPIAETWQTHDRTTLVVAASQKPLDLSSLVAWTPLSQEELAAYLALEKPLILTDEYVPVDNLLAPVFEDSHRN